MDDPLSFKEYALFYTVGIFGLSCSITSLIFIYKRPILHTAFGYICAANSFAETGILGIFVFSGIYSAIVSPKGSRIAAHLCIFCYCGALYLHSLKSLNRFCAIVFPFKYQIWFSGRNAKVSILIAFGLAFLNSGTHFWYECSAYFSGETYFFTTVTLECDSTITFYADFILTCTTTPIALGCDIFSFTYIRIRFKKANASSRNDYKLALHAYFTTLIYMTSTFSFWVLSHLATNRFTLFLTTTLAWIFCHSMNQFSFIIFVKFLQRKRKQSTFTVAPAS